MDPNGYCSEFAEGWSGVAWLSADARLREQARVDMVAIVRERWSWEGVACGVIAAACGELDVLALP